MPVYILLSLNKVSSVLITQSKRKCQQIVWAGFVSVSFSQRIAEKLKFEQKLEWKPVSERQCIIANHNCQQVIGGFSQFHSLYRRYYSCIIVLWCVRWFSLKSIITDLKDAFNKSSTKQFSGLSSTQIEIRLSRKAKQNSYIHTHTHHNAAKLNAGVKSAD